MKTLHQHLDECEKRLLERTLHVCGYNKMKTGRLLGISRVTVYKLMKKHKILNKPVYFRVMPLR